MSRRRDPHDAHPPVRTEPTLGDIDRLDAPRAPATDGLPQVSVEPRHPRGGQAAPPRRRRGWLLPLLLLAIAAAGVLWFNQNRLRGMLPRTDFNTVLAQAQQALQDGRLDGQDGTSARNCSRPPRRWNRTTTAPATACAGSARPSWRRPMPRCRRAIWRWPRSRPRWPANCSAAAVTSTGWTARSAAPARGRCRRWTWSTRRG
ncbi:hypothetical protein AB7872_13805 [Rhodanobacter denitrificans]|uniref:hypothetical protein n=1 Tax=Rhodanobacter sp. FW106-PBR-LB-1-21 TaxID=3454842 RepID=UPI0034E47E46